jgi:hypothetical protein
MTAANPDDALRAAVSASSAEKTSARIEADTRHSRVEAYIEHRQAIEKRLAATAERVVDLLVAAPGKGGLSSVVVRKGLVRKTSIDGWMLKTVHDGGHLLLPTKAVAYFHRDGYRVIHRTTVVLAEWVSSELYPRTYNVDSAVTERSFTDKSNWLYGDASTDVGLRSSLVDNERTMMGYYAELLNAAGISL